MLVFERPEEQGVIVVARAVDRNVPREASADWERDIGQGPFDLEVCDDKSGVQRAITRMITTYIPARLG